MPASLRCCQQLCGAHVTPPPPPPGPRQLGPTGWDQETRDAARQALAARAPDVNSVVPAEISDTLRRAGIEANPTNVATRLKNKQSELANVAKQKGRPIRPADIFNLGATDSSGRRLLSVAPLAARLGLAEPEPPTSHPSDDRQTGEPAHIGSPRSRSHETRESEASSKESSGGRTQHRRGGIIGRALSIAKQYAAGGAVHAGPITEVADGGRTDTFPTDVRQSSYVIPADIVSWLGQGDTGAGYRVLTHMFGPHSPGHARPGEKTVPVMVAGGEFVVSPAAVARVGRGDIRAGHDALDHWAKMERRKNIQKLKKLPGPQRD